MHIWQDYHRSDVVSFSVHPVGEPMNFILTGGINLDYLIKVVFARLLHCYISLSNCFIVFFPLPFIPPYPLLWLSFLIFWQIFCGKAFWGYIINHQSFIFFIYLYLHEYIDSYFFNGLYPLTAIISINALVFPDLVLGTVQAGFFILLSCPLILWAVAYFLTWFAPDYLSLALLQPWNQPFLQRALAPFNGEWH